MQSGIMANPPSALLSRIRAPMADARFWVLAPPPPLLLSQMPLHGRYKHCMVPVTCACLESKSPTVVGAGPVGRVYARACVPAMREARKKVSGFSLQEAGLTEWETHKQGRGIQEIWVARKHADVLQRC